MEEPEKKFLTPEQAISKLEYYCSYQDRCHTEVVNKLYQIGVSTAQHDAILVHLIQENFLNEERFAKSFARGKHRMSGWGKNRITAELTYKKISPYLIKKALEELPDDLYFETFNRISTQKWNTTSAKNPASKKEKVIAYLYRKGYESEYIFDRIKELEQE